MNTQEAREARLDDLIKTVEDPDVSDDDLIDAARCLLELEDGKAVKPMLHRLVSVPDSFWVREHLVTILGTLVLLTGCQSNNVRDVFLLILASPSEHKQVRSSAAAALGSLNDERAVEPLLNMIRSEEPELAFSAAMALGQIGDSRAVSPLTKLLKDDRYLFPQTAAEALGKLGAVAVTAIPELRRLAEEGSDVERRYAREAIARIRGS